MIEVSYLHTIVLSGYWTEEHWQSWADELILHNSELEYWVYDVAFAKDKDELLLAIAQVLVVFDEETSYSEQDVIVGYYYMMYLEGRMGLEELLYRLSDEDDDSNGYQGRDSQKTRDIIDRAKRGGKNLEELDALLTPFVRPAKEQLYKLTHYLMNDN